ncbi:MAG: zf-TFIIB domain-containing protein [Acidobacteria bacterium]|nr:zf-TFIIB domain-containing protein [Acidobacteriota bacterium]
MQCPIDQTTLAMTERQGVEIDYCPKCRGVWLDRGELDKLIAGGGAESGSGHRAEHPPPQFREQRTSYSDDRRYKEDRHYKDDHYYKKKKKESFLKDLFDF